MAPALLGPDRPDLDPNIHRVGTREFEVAEVAGVRSEQNQRVDLGLRARAYVVTGDALAGDPDEVRARRSQDIPLRGYGEPAEFGRVAAFLLSPAASYITGAMIPVDGGAIRSI